MSQSCFYAGLPSQFFGNINLAEKLTYEQQIYLCKLVRYNWRAFEKAAKSEVVNQLSHTSPCSDASLMDDEYSNKFARYDECISLPRFNSQGHVKIIKCKQCDYLAITKLNFWTHLEVHIKPQKKLSCELCPFITEYKHHLDYHLFNHNGAKPYKCPKCEYSCVNKSMLNSHLKSHSSIHQYTCDDCEYKTKYIHSLKQHLRKHNHRPAVVKNADGTPNPLVLIDVHGFKRGPKQRPSKVQEDQCNAQVGLNCNKMDKLPASLPSRIPFQMPVVQNQLNISAMNGSNGLVNNGISGVSSVDRVNEVKAVNNINGVVPDYAIFMAVLCFNNFMSSFSIPHSIYGEDAVRELAIFKTFLDVANMNAQKASDESFEDSISFSSKNISQNEDDSSTSSSEIFSTLTTSISSDENDRLDEEIQPLDLSVNKFKSRPITNSPNCQKRVSKRKPKVVRRISRSELITLDNE